jgi:hypothetical protein
MVGDRDPMGVAGQVVEKALVQMALAASVTVTFGELRTNGERTE